MSFKITTKEGPGKKITWKFETHDEIFTSDVERFKRNVQFWKQKLMVDDTVQVELLSGAQWLQDHLVEERNIQDVEHEIVEENDDELITDSLPEFPECDEPAEQPSVPQDTETPVDTPKRKPRKKATDL